MRKLLSLLAALALLWGAAAGAAADGGVFSMAGCDTSPYRRDWNTHLFFQRMAEETGVSFTFRTFSDAADFGRWKMSLTPDSAELPDVLFKACLSDAEIRALGSRGVLIDLTPYLETCMPNLSALFREHPEWRAAVTQPDGRILTLPMIDPLQVNNILWINTAWLSALKLEMPKDRDSLTAVLRAFRTGDPNANGRADEIPLTFTGMWDLKWLLHASGIVMNDYSLSCDENGAVSCPLTGDAMREALEWLHGLWTEGLLDSSGFVAGETLRKTTDENAAPYGTILRNNVLNYLPDHQLNRFDAVPPLQHGGKTVYRSLLGDLTRGTFAVTCRCADPEAVLRWADVLYTEAGCFLARAGLKDREYTVDSEGNWRWNYPNESLGREVYAKVVIGDDLPMPGYVPASFQLRFGDETLRRQVEQCLTVAEKARPACPPVTFTEEEAARLAEIWPPLGRYIEYRLTWFVTGDEPLDDSTWAAFRDGIDGLGMREVVQIWQTAADRFEEAKR